MRAYCIKQLHPLRSNQDSRAVTCPAQPRRVFGDSLMGDPIAHPPNNHISRHTCWGGCNYGEGMNLRSCRSPYSQLNYCTWIFTRFFRPCFFSPCQIAVGFVYISFFPRWQGQKIHAKPPRAVSKLFSRICFIVLSSANF